MDACMYACTHACMYVCMYACMCVCVCMAPEIAGKIHGDVENNCSLRALRAEGNGCLTHSVPHADTRWRVLQEGQGACNIHDII